MVYQYDFDKKNLFLKDVLLPMMAYNTDEIGLCRCSGPLKLLSAHTDAPSSEKDAGRKFLVSACTKCSSVYVNIYNSSWSWLADAEPKFIESKMEPASSLSEKERVFKIPIYSEIADSAESFKKIPMEQLKTVFSTTEIQAIFQKANGEKNVRQYYHRAKKKYQKFEEIYGIRIDI
jgi:hypothetical protein